MKRIEDPSSKESVILGRVNYRSLFSSRFLLWAESES